MTSREQAKELASELFNYFLEHGSPTPVRGQPTGWDEVWVDKIESALAAPALGWTTEKPTVPGWYWWRNVGHVEPAGIVEFDGTMAAFTNGFCEAIELLPGEWAGPLVVLK